MNGFIMTTRNIKPGEIEFFLRKGRMERSMAVHEFFSRRYGMVKKYMSQRPAATTEKLMPADRLKKLSQERLSIVRAKAVQREKLLFMTT